MTDTDDTTPLIEREDRYVPLTAETVIDIVYTAGYRMAKIEEDRSFRLVDTEEALGPITDAIKEE